MYEIKCKDNEGFENMITEGKQYKVIAFQTNSVMIKDDNGNARWLGELHFDRPKSATK